MKIKLDIDFKEFDELKANEEDVKELFLSFCEYLEHNVFFFQKCPRLYESINIEDILHEWAEKTYKESANHKFNKLYRVLETSFEVIDISHSRNYISIYCTDTAKQD